MKTLTAILMFLGVFLTAVCVVLFVSLVLFPQSSLSEQVRVVVESSGQKDLLPLSENIYAAFRTTLQAEVRSSLGASIKDYEPSMYLQVFPGLTETDFEGVEASIGYYTVEEGRLVHKLDDTQLIHSAAKAITDKGMDTLLRNVSSRLKVDLASNGTLTKIINALAYIEETPKGTWDEPVACTMDAKICPDGTAVGRVGPSCEFSPCP